MFGYPSLSQITEHTQPGFYKIDNAAYHASPGLSSSRIKAAIKGYAHYVKPQEQTDAMAFGTAFHAAMLEPEVWAKYHVSPDVDKRTKAYKDWVSCLPDGASFVTPEEKELIGKMCAAVRDHPDWVDTTGHNEVAAVARMGSVLVKCKADSLGGQIIDLKSTSGSVTPGGFLRSVVDFGYHTSAAFYQDIFHLLTGERLPFVIVAVAKNPVDVEIYELSDDLLDAGRKLYQAGMRRIARWESSPDNVKKEKRKRVLQPSSYLLYNTTETLEFIGD